MDLAIRLHRDAPLVPPAERMVVIEAITRAGRPSMDYYLMIGLSSIIASLGLLLDSPAVIIGAMLVAPLMSAILGLGLGAIRGSSTILKWSLGAVVSGALLAVVIGAIAGRLSPGAEITAEVASRARPGLLDLAVALASGAAGAYAICRKDVSAALVGVAIAAALVPPLAAVGIGIALVRFDVAGGALLLFLTNLIAITAASGLVFLAMGFAPYRLQHMQRSMLRRGLLSTVSLLLVMTGVLTYLTVTSVRTTTLERQARLAVEREVAKYPEAELVQVDVRRGDDGGVSLSVTLRSTRSFDYQTVLAFQAGVATRLQLPTALVLQVVPLVRLDPLIPPTFTPTLTQTPTATPTNTSTPTSTPTVTHTSTRTYTPTATRTPSATDSRQSTYTPTPSRTKTPTGTATATMSDTVSPLRTPGSSSASPAPTSLRMPAPPLGGTPVS